jgi:hypothetical protein
MSNQVIVSIFMLVLVMIIALYLGSKNYNGFTFSKSQLREYPYEGFTSYQEAFELREGIDIKRSGTKSATEASKPTTTAPATTAPAPQSSLIGSGPDKSLFSSSPSSLNEPTVFNVQDKPKVTVEMPKVTIEMPGTDAKEGFETSSEQKVAGFKGLYGSPYEGQKPIGFMYNNKGSTTCKNYGYTNSQGFVCMSENDIKLLTTRGGNAFGVSDQIGK